MIVAVTMVRDEDDVIDTVLRHLLAEGVDHLIVADNLSTDRTPHILNDLQACGAPLTIVQDDVLAYEQSKKMSRLARQAYDMGATWVLPFDADEIWYAPGSTIAEALTALPEDVCVVRAPGWDHVVSRVDGRPGSDGVTGYNIGYGACAADADPPPFSPYRRERTQQMVKVAFRAHPDAVVHMGNHDVQRPGNDRVGVLAYRHFQYRSLEQMTRKLRNGRQAYEASDIHPMHGTHWRAGGLKSDAELAADWAALCAEDGLVFDPAPIRVPVA